MLWLALVGLTDHLVHNRIKGGSTGIPTYLRPKSLATGCVGLVASAARAPRCPASRCRPALLCLTVR